MYCLEPNLLKYSIKILEFSHFMVLNQIFLPLNLILLFFIILMIFQQLSIPPKFNRLNILLDFNF